MPPPFDISTPESRATLFGYLISASLTGRLSQSQIEVIHRSLAMAMRDAPIGLGSLFPNADWR